MLKQEIGERIRTARKHCRLTQRSLARLLGCSFQLVQQYEHGDKLTIDRVCAISEVLHVVPEMLLIGDCYREKFLPRDRTTSAGSKPMRSAKAKNSTTSIRRPPASRRATQV